MAFTRWIDPTHATLLCASLLFALIAAGAAGSDQRTVVYQHDDLGRLVSADDGTIRIDYEYDEGGNLLLRTVPEPSVLMGLVPGIAVLLLLGRSRYRSSSARAARCGAMLGLGAALLLAPTTSRALSGDVYGAWLGYVCDDDSIGSLNGSPEACPDTAHDGIPSSCGTNVFTAAGIVVTEEEFFDGTNTKITVSVESADGSDFLPGGLFCAPGNAIRALRFVLGKLSQINMALQNDPLAHGLTPDPTEIVSAEAVVEGTAGTELLRISLGLDGALVSFLEHIFTISGADAVPITAMRFCFVLAGEPSAPPPHMTAAETYEAGDFSLISDEIDPADAIAKEPVNQAPAVIDPVVVTTGEFVGLDELDRDVGGPHRLRFARRYASYAGEAAARAGVHGVHDGPLGAHWSHGFHLLLRRESATRVNLLHRKGAVLIFEKPAATWELQPNGYQGIPYQLVENGSKLELMDPTVRRIYRFEFAATPDLGVAPVESIRDRNGNTHTLTYNPDGTLASVDDGLGRSLTFTHATSAGVPRIASVTDQAGRVVAYAYDGANLESVTDARLGVTQYTYDGNHALTSLTRPESNVALQNTYLANGRVLTQSDAESNTHHFFYAPLETVVTDPLGHMRRFVYDAGARVTQFVDEAGNPTVYTYDAEGRTLTTTDRIGDVQSLTYHAPSGYVATRTDAASNTWTYNWQAQLQEGFAFYVLERIDRPDGSEVSFLYDASGNPTSVTDGEGNLTTFSYNGRGQPLTATNGALGVSTWTYHSDATIDTIEDPSGNVTTFGYDAEKRITSIQRPGITLASLTWDANDNLVSSTDENGNTRTFGYDANDNLTSITDPENHIVNFAYDDNDDLVQITDPASEVALLSRDELQRVDGITDRRGQLTRFVYDARRRLEQVIDANTQTWTFGYDDEGVPTSLTNPDGDRWLNESDALGRSTRTEDPLGHATVTTYDELGRIVRVTDALGRITDFVRDFNGRITAVHLDLPGHSALYARNALQQIEAVTDLRSEVWQTPYDAQGRLASRIDPLASQQTYAYDTRNRVSQVTFAGGLGTVDYTYDDADRLVQIDYSDGTSFSRSYDADNLLLTTDGVALGRDVRGQISASGALAMTYDPDGRLETVTYAPGKTITYTYDARGQLDGITDWAGGATTVKHANDGRLLFIEHSNGTRTDYGYDESNRLVALTETDVGTAAQLSSIALTRDASGQIAQAVRDQPLQPVATPTAVDLTYDAASQEATASYDAKGRRTDDGRQFSWNLADQMLSYTESGSTVTFTHDAFGNTLTRTEASVTRSFEWNHALDLPSIATESEDGVPLRHHVYTPDGRLLFSLEADDDARHVYHFDEVGSTLFVTDGSAQVIQSYAYSPWGEVLAESGGFDNAFTWHGRHGVRREGSLYAMRARYYDPVRARFLSRDPLELIDARSANPYQALFGDPLRYIDPLGTDPQDAEDPPHLETFGEWLFDRTIGLLPMVTSYADERRRKAWERETEEREQRAREKYEEAQRKAANGGRGKPDAAKRRARKPSYIAVPFGNPYQFQSAYEEWIRSTGEGFDPNSGGCSGDFSSDSSRESSGDHFYNWRPRSYGPSGCTSGYPSVYSRQNYFMMWLQEAQGSSEDNAPRSQRAPTPFNESQQGAEGRR